ncbi:MAG: outer membrane lipid asymmetry maintenance protein MlaD [Alphaproteobacteria bacterium]|nr:outer membrane lipid asymmetry maintenance protein MlaD [Alphaproteobacteria bacterium]
MKANMIEAVMGAIVLIIATFFLVFAYTSSKGGVYTGYPLIAKFDRIDGLAVGNDVRISGVKVGSITSVTIDPKTFLARVVMTVQNGLALPTDSAAEIMSESMMGGKYIALVPGGSNKTLKPNERITYTQSSVSLESLLGKYLFSSKDNKSPGPSSPENSTKK